MIFICFRNAASDRNNGGRFENMMDDDEAAGDARGMQGTRYVLKRKHLDTPRGIVRTVMLAIRLHHSGFLNCMSLLQIRARVCSHVHLVRQVLLEMDFVLEGRCNWLAHHPHAYCLAAAILCRQRFLIGILEHCREICDICFWYP